MFEEVPANQDEVIRLCYARLLELARLLDNPEKIERMEWVMEFGFHSGRVSTLSASEDNIEQIKLSAVDTVRRGLPDNPVSQFDVMSYGNALGCLQVIQDEPIDKWWGPIPTLIKQSRWLSINHYSRSNAGKLIEAHSKNKVDWDLIKQNILFKLEAHRVRLEAEAKN